MGNENCQARIFSIEGKHSESVNVYNLNMVGATSMIDVDGKSIANYSDNLDVFPDNIAVFRLGATADAGAAKIVKRELLSHARRGHYGLL